MSGVASNEVGPHRNWRPSHATIDAARSHRPSVTGVTMTRTPSHMSATIASISARSGPAAGACAQGHPPETDDGAEKVHEAAQGAPRHDGVVGRSCRRRRSIHGVDEEGRAYDRQGQAGRDDQQRVHPRAGGSHKVRGSHLPSSGFGRNNETPEGPESFRGLLTERETGLEPATLRLGIALSPSALAREVAVALDAERCGGRRGRGPSNSCESWYNPAPSLYSRPRGLQSPVSA